MAKDIIFKCPSCGKPLRAESGDAGRSAFCPFCQGDLMVPLLLLSDREREAALKILEAALGERSAGDRDRRLFVRFSSEGVRVKMSGDISCRPVNLSRGGMLLACRSGGRSQPPAVGSTVRFTLITPYGKDITAQGVVLWSREGGSQPEGGTSVGGMETSSSQDEVLIGVEFSGIEENDSEALRRLERMLVDGTAGGRERREKREKR